MVTAVRWQQAQELWTADVEGWALTVGPMPMPDHGWLYSVEPSAGGNVPSIMGECRTVEQGRCLAEAAMDRLSRR